MAKYKVTFSCGHSDIVSLTGNHEDRERRIEWYETSGLCPQCRAEIRNHERAEANAEAAAKAEELNLPVLEGSEKQVTWATTIRQQFINNIAQSKLTERERAVYDYMIKNVLKASSWIDMRNEFVEDVIELYRKDYEAYYINETNPTKEDKINIDCIVKPENAQSNEFAVISVISNVITIKHPRNETFRQIVKKLGYRWDPDKKVWSRTITKYNGTVEDRAAEVGNALLRGGISVKITDDDIRQAAIDAKFAPEQSRWIKYCVSGKYEGWLDISWRGNNDALYNAARRIKGSKWNQGSVMIHMQYYNEVLDFAEINDFSISERAQREIDRFISSLVTISPAEPKKEQHKDKLQEILNSDEGVLDDLKD